MRRIANIGENSGSGERGIADGYMISLYRRRSHHGSASRELLLIRPARPTALASTLTFGSVSIIAYVPLQAPYLPSYCLRFKISCFSVRCSTVANILFFCIALGITAFMRTGRAKGVCNTQITTIELSLTRFAQHWQLPQLCESIFRCPCSPEELHLQIKTAAFSQFCNVAAICVRRMQFSETRRSL